jgi:uncharacterized protein YciI
MRQQDAWAEHASFMNALEDDGFVILGGPLGADGDHVGALLIVKAASEAELVTRLSDDPWAKRDILAIDNIEPMTILLDSRGGS